jgi:tRNA(fMet)-specific endonuclease VapC
MRYLLDTDHISIIQRRSGDPYQRLRDRINHYDPTDFGLCLISFHEQSLGANNVIQNAKTVVAIVSGYELINQILQGFFTSPVVSLSSALAAPIHSIGLSGTGKAMYRYQENAIAQIRSLIKLFQNC